jgi:hypothetical protein
MWYVRGVVCRKTTAELLLRGRGVIDRYNGCQLIERVELRLAIAMAPGEDGRILLFTG